MKKKRRSRRPGKAALKILFEDEDIIVVDKPAGLLTIATERERVRTAYHLLTDHVRSTDPRAHIFIVHRLDRDTSGLLLFAKNAPAKRGLQERWSEVVTDRAYVAVVEGRVSGPGGTVRSMLTENRAHRVYSTRKPGEGRPAVTHFEVLSGNADYTLLRLRLETGRKNQIRVHMQDIGHPVAGDKKYGARTNPARRLALHAERLAFHHPRTGELLSFESPVPTSFQRIVRERGE